MLRSIFNGAFSIACLFLVTQLHCSDAVEKFKLSSGYEIPSVGLGTFLMKPEEIDNALGNALESGYRHIDTAYLYYNEEAIGRTLEKWFQKGGKREELFITTKLPLHGNRPNSVEKYLKRSLKDLGLEYVDLYLIHGPLGFDEDAYENKNKTIVFESVDHVAVWKKMEEQVKAGRVKSIGLSNFNESQILNVYNNAEIKPSNLQVETHAYFQQKPLQEFCKNNNIVMTAYAPLGSPSIRNKSQQGTDRALPPLSDPVIKDIAKKYNKSEGQILLRHLVQAGLVVIPKSSNKERQKANIDIFDFTLNEEDVAKINALDKGGKGRVFDFKFVKNVDQNPQYPFPSRDEAL